MNLSVGKQASHSLTLTPGRVKTYAALTGGHSPLHSDEGFAWRTRFGRLVVSDGETVLAGEVWCYTFSHG